MNNKKAIRLLLNGFNLLPKYKKAYFELRDVLWDGGHTQISLDSVSHISDEIIEKNKLLGVEYDKMYDTIIRYLGGNEEQNIIDLNEFLENFIDKIDIEYYEQKTKKSR